VSRGDINVNGHCNGNNQCRRLWWTSERRCRGLVSYLYADFNSVVKEGQVIARIDTTFLWQAVKDADAALDRAKAQTADSKRTFRAAKLRFLPSSSIRR